MLPPIFRPPADSAETAPPGKPPTPEIPAGDKIFFAPRNEPGTFHLALTMAGTVSAAAYTAGVVDFLIEALDAWEDAKKAGDVPTHQVKLHAISGTSGGGITAGITAATLFCDFDAMRREEVQSTQALPAVRNRLYDTWVRAISIQKLLATDDLSPKQKPRSLLNSMAIDRVAEQVLDMALPNPPKARKWVERELHLFITSANLRGIPYRIQFTGTTGLGYPMLGHFNYQHFLVCASAPKAAWLIHLDPAAIKGGALDSEMEGKRLGWPALVDATRATSAFPMGFAARRLGHPAVFYSKVQWLYADENLKLTPTTVDPDWYVDFERAPPLDKDSIEFLNVDGGAINNEPFELARVALSGVDGRNPRDAMQADRAVIMIDPLFRPDPGYDPVDDAGNPIKVNGEIVRGRVKRRDDASIFAVASSLLGTFVANSRFKPGELGLAADETVFSRFLVAPRSVEVQEDGKRKYDRYPIFGELMGAFAAFLHEDLRHFDYRLGRENARAFLLRWFALPEDNQVFSWPDDKREQWIERYAVKEDNNLVRIQEYENGQKKGKPQRLIPIIPLVGTAAAEIAIPERSALLKHLSYNAHEGAIRKRLNALFDAVKREVATDKSGPIAWLTRNLTKLYLDIGWLTALRGKLVEQVRTAFQTAREQAAERIERDRAKRFRPAANQRKKDNGWHRV